MPGAHVENHSHRIPADRGPTKDAWDDDSKDCITSLSLSRMLPTGAKPRSFIRGRSYGDVEQCSEKKTQAARTSNGQTAH
ncbi:hypothetical protein RB195_022839 [Necator americanus]|uniref:Uncharacterized protein n=1 Tax=Necator americanus TaxID=51031 RepID=A0ABR1EGS4_NECAM